MTKQSANTGVGDQKEAPGHLVHLGVGLDIGTMINGLLAGEEADVVARIAGVGFPAPEGLTEADVPAFQDGVLLFLDAAGRTEAGGSKREAVLDALTQRGIAVLEPPLPETRPAQPPEGGAAPRPAGGAQEPPVTHPAKAPETRSAAAPDAEGLVELVVLRDDGLAGAGGAFVAAGQRGKFSSDEAYAHLTAGNARLPTPED